MLSKYLIIVTVLMVSLSSALLPVKVHAREIDSQTFNTIKSTLNVNVPDDRLKAVLNQQSGSGTLIGDNVITYIYQLNYGLDLHSSSYLSQYTIQFNSRLDSYMVGQLNGIAINGFKSGLLNFFEQVGFQGIGTVYSLIDIAEKVHDIVGLIDLLRQELNDRAMLYYIDARKGSASDADAWSEASILLPIEVTSSIDSMQRAHLNFLNAWEAYRLADYYNANIEQLKNYVSSTALPQPSFTTNPSSGIVPLTVTFDASGSTPINGTTIQSYSWDFDDGVTDSGITTTHTFNTTDYFTVTLTVTDSDGVTNSTSKTITVTSPVHAIFSTSQNALTVHFDASGSTDDKGNSHISSYKWVFGDGSTTTTSGTNVDHTYTADAWKYVTLAVTDDLGYSDTYTKTVKVGSPPGDLGTTVYGGTITGNVTWSADASPYIVNGTISVARNATLTIELGVTVKFTQYGQLTVNGTLKANGVKFTWADGQNEWSGIRFNGESASNSRLENCVIEHAQGTSGWSDEPSKAGAIYIGNSSPLISGCNIKDSTATAGIYVRQAGTASSPTITSTTIQGFSSNRYGLYVKGGASPLVRSSTFSGNGYGVFIDSSSGGTYTGNTFSGNQYGLYYSGTSSITATNNNWGDPSGPLDASDDRATGGLYNPNGKGNKVSDKVNYYPWIGATISVPTTPVGFSATPGNASANLTWTPQTTADPGGYKIYSGTASGTTSTTVIVGNVSSYKLTGLANDTTYYISISSMNSVGAESAKSAEITVKPIYDITAPTITTFTATATTGSPVVTLSLIATDEIGGTGVTDYCIQETATNTVCTWRSTAPTRFTFTTIGEKTLYAWVRDGAGNISANKSTTVIVDTVGPTLTLSTLANSAVTNNATLNVSGTVEGNGSSVKNLLVNGQASTIAADGTFSVAIALIAGTNTITTIATDTANNQTADTRTFTLDSAAPALTVTTTVDNSKTAQALATVSGTTNESYTVTLTLNSSTPQNVTKTGSAYSASVTLVNGLNNITIMATDLAGKTSSTVRTVTFNTGKPSVAITSPNQDIAINQNSITISGTVSDILTPATVSINFNNQIYNPTVTNGTFTQLLTIPFEGTFAIIANATDEAGNNSSTTRNVIFTSKPGDCDNSGTVTIAEVQSAINMFLGLKNVESCVNQDGAGGVSIAEVQKTINSFLGL